MAEEAERPIQDQITDALGELAENEHILNFHRGVAALPEWLGGNLKAILGVGDMNHELTERNMIYGRVGTELFKEFDVFICYPWIENAAVVKANLEYILANSPHQKVICYLDIHKPEQVEQFVTLFEGRMGFITAYRGHCPHFGIASIFRLLRPGGKATEVFEFYDKFYDPKLNEYVDRLRDFYEKTVSERLSREDMLAAYGNLGDHSYGNRGWLDMLPLTHGKQILTTVIQYLSWCYIYLHRFSKPHGVILTIARPLEVRLEELFEMYKDGVIPYPSDSVNFETIRLLSYVVKCLLLAHFLPNDLFGTILVTDRGKPMLQLQKFGRMNGGRRKRTLRRRKRRLSRRR